MSISLDIDNRRPEPKRDRWGRYLVQPADGGKPVGHTRVTTFAKAIADTHNLTEWAKRNVALGMAQRPDLVAMAHGLTHEDRAGMKEVIDGAEEASGANARRRIGTALHSMAERVDLGTLALEDVPEANRADVAAYAATIKAETIRMPSAYIERVCIIPRWTLAGTFDRIAWIGGVLYVADLKTGKRVDYAAAEIAMQLACYANAETMYDLETEQHEPMPPVNKERALVIHVPAGEGRCELHWVDIAAGYEACELAADVRTWRKRKGLLMPYEITGTAPAATVDEGFDSPQIDGAAQSEPERVTDDEGRAGSPLDDRKTWAIAAIEDIKSMDPEPRAAALKELRTEWPEGVPTFPKGMETGFQYSLTDIAAVCAAIIKVQSHHEVPFGDPDPGSTAVKEAATPEWSAPGGIIEEGDDLSPELVAETRGIIAKLDAPERTQIQAWGEQGVAAKRPWGFKDKATVRRHRIASAAITMLRWSVLDDDAREALSIVMGELVTPAIPVGQALGSLTIEEAERLIDVVTALAAGHAITFDSGIPALAAA